MNPWFMRFNPSITGKKESNPYPPKDAKKPPAPPAPPAKRIIKEDDYKQISNFPTSETKKRTTITLEDDEAALVMNSNGQVDLYFPDMDEEATVPDHIQFISALAAVATTDQEVIDLIWKKFYKCIDEAN